MMQSKKGFANLVHAQNWLDDAIFSEKNEKKILMVDHVVSMQKVLC
jgi:hypothetical protein